METKIFKVDKSRYSFDETCEKISSAVLDKSWKISVVHDLKETMAKSGVEVLPVKVFAVCNPVYAAMMLQNDDYRILSSMMPCRISVYEKSDKSVSVSRMDSDLFSQFLDNSLKSAIVRASADVEEIIAIALK